MKKLLLLSSLLFITGLHLSFTQSKPTVLVHYLNSEDSNNSDTFMLEIAASSIADIFRTDHTLRVIDPYDLNNLPGNRLESKCSNLQCLFTIATEIKAKYVVFLRLNRYESVREKILFFRIIDIEKNSTIFSATEPIAGYSSDFMEAIKETGRQLLQVVKQEIITSRFSPNNEVRIGIIAPLSGEAATFGESAANGAKLYFDQVNAAGGVSGMKITYFIEDDKGDPADGVYTYAKLIDQSKVSAIVGSVMSKVSLAGAPIAQKRGIPMISPTSTHPAVTLVGNFIFRACFIDPFQGLVAAKFAYNDLGKNTAAVLYDAGNDYTKGLAEVFRDEFGKMGGKITAFESYAAGTSDFNAQLVKIKATNPDVLFIPNYYYDAGLIAKQARAMGIKSVFLGGDGWDSPDLIKIGGKAIEGGFFVNHFSKDSQVPAAKKFVADYKAKYNEDPDALAALAYEAAMIVVDSIKRAKSADPKAIRDAMEQTNLETLTGVIKFDANRNPVKGAVILEVKDGYAVYKATVSP